jgi:hypothetical protein
MALVLVASLALLTLEALDFPLAVPRGFLKVFDRVAFETGTPQVLHRIAHIQTEVLDDVDALDPSRMGVVMRRVIDCVGDLWSDLGHVDLLDRLVRLVEDFRIARVKLALHAPDNPLLDFYPTHVE